MGSLRFLGQRNLESKGRSYSEAELAEFNGYTQFTHLMLNVFKQISKLRLPFLKGMHSACQSFELTPSCDDCNFEIAKFHAIMRDLS